MFSTTGEIAATFAAAEGRTKMMHKYQTSPLKIAKTFRYENEPGPLQSGVSLYEEQLGVYMMDCSPGLMSGDVYELKWHLLEGASVFLTNQSFTKVHPSIKEGSVQRQWIRLEAHALLEYMPEPVMLYKDASMSGETEIKLEPGATLIMSDILCPGRAGRGEKFHYRLYKNRMKVFYEEELIFYQNQLVEPAKMELAAPGCWENETHIGSLYIFSDLVRPVHVEAILTALSRLLESRSTADRVLSVRFGASLTYKHGIVCTVMGTHAWQLQFIIHEAWRVVRSTLLGLLPRAVAK
jgi:urease accessory protein